MTRYDPEPKSDLPPVLRLMAEHLTDGDLWDSTHEILVYLWSNDGEMPPGTGNMPIPMGATTAGAIWALWSGRTHPEWGTNKGVESLMRLFEGKLDDMFKGGSSIPDALVRDADKLQVLAMRADTARGLIEAGGQAGLDPMKWRKWVMSEVFGFDGTEYERA